MLPIYICEDNAIMREALTAEIKRQLLIHEYDMNILQATNDPKVLIATVKSNPQRGIYFLDIDLNNPFWNGFSLGNKLRSYDPHGYIIYVTAHDDLAYKTFEYHLEVFDYIAKTPTSNMIHSIRTCLAAIVDKANLESNHADSQVFTVKENNCTKIIPLRNILFFETSVKKHHIILYTSCERIEFTGKLQEIQKKIGTSFLRTHRSFLVQLDKIKEVNYKHRVITLENGQCCFFSRSMRQTIQQTVGV